MHLEDITELDILTKQGIMQICKFNRDIFVSYSHKQRDELYELFIKLLEQNIKINIPLLDEKFN
jgi:hypothetical protein